MTDDDKVSLITARAIANEARRAINEAWERVEYGSDLDPMPELSCALRYLESARTLIEQVRFAE